jgi:hypothetical protein
MLRLLVVVLLGSMVLARPARSSKLLENEKEIKAMRQNDRFNRKMVSRSSLLRRLEQPLSTDNENINAFPDEGCEKKSDYLEVCTTESTVTYKIGNPKKGKVADDELIELDNMYAVYYRKISITDVQSGTERDTSSGKKHKFCQAPEGSKVVKVRVRFLAGELHTFRNLEFIWRTPDGNLYECGKAEHKKATTDSWEIGDEEKLSFQGYRILKTGKKYITLMEFEFGRSVKGLEAMCSMTKPVAVVEKVLTGMVTTESMEDYEGTTKIKSTATSHSHEAGVEVTVAKKSPAGGVEASASFSYTNTQTSEKGTEKATATAKSTEITIDLTDKFMVSYFLMIPCKLPDKVESDSGKHIMLAPYDHRLRRLILPVESCLSESETVQGTKGGKGGKVDLVVDGSVDVDSGSCKLPQNFIWYDESNLMNDIAHLVDIKGSGVLNNREKIPIDNPQPANTIQLR